MYMSRGILVGNGRQINRFAAQNVEVVHIYSCAAKSNLGWNHKKLGLEIAKRNLLYVSITYMTYISDYIYH